MKALSDPQNHRHASRGSETLSGLAWVPVLSSDLGEEALGSGETLGMERVDGVPRRVAQLGPGPSLHAQGLS